MRPWGMVTREATCSRYWNGMKKCRPPRSTSGWKPASPPSAIRPARIDPRPLHSFSTTAMRLLPIERTKPDARTGTPARTTAAAEPIYGPSAYNDVMENPDGRLDDDGRL